MRRRKQAAGDAAGRPPEWVTSTLAGLVKFDGDGVAWGRARAQWCAEHHCRRTVVCSPWGRAQCEASRLGGQVAGTGEKSTTELQTGD